MSNMTDDEYILEVYKELQANVSGEGGG